MAHGGHTRQMHVLISQLLCKLDLGYVINKRHLANPKANGMQGEIYHLYGARTVTSGIIHDICGAIFMFFQAVVIYLKARPDAVITTGTSPAVPFLILGKLIGIKTIFIETISRPYKLSGSGRVLYPFADLFFVQWQSLANRYPKAIMGGHLT